MALHITIEYCAPCHYEPHALELAAKLMKLKLDLASLTLVPKDGRLFEVIVNGKKIHSKAESDEFPQPDVILHAIRALR
ncbi:MAG: SelT/SelW/SelH family protein [Verrucomicrobia bacterium]|nr:SelT/SelW/SelH family protein [Verrucomicrobiota bacterium]